MSIDLISEAEEASLAMAQAVISRAMQRAKLSYEAVGSACGMSGHAVRRLLAGDSHITVREMGALLAACGREPRFESVPYASGRIRL